MNIYDKRDGNVRINIYEPLSSKQYPMDLDFDTMSLIVGEVRGGRAQRAEEDGGGGGGSDMYLVPKRIIINSNSSLRSS